MPNNRRSVEYVIRLPKEFKIDSLNTNSIPLDGEMMVTIRENHRNLGKMKLRDARRKYG